MKNLIALLSVFISLNITAQNPITYVNPFIGTGGHGHTFPGATVPFGFVQLSPDTRPDGYNDWDGCGGYHYSDSIIYGFSHTHLSGTGVPDYCDILLMPTIGEVQLENIKDNNPKLGYASLFSHKSERASPGFYSVILEDDNIAVELTASARVGMHKYQFPNAQKANIILDLTHRDKLLEGSFIEIVSPTKIQGLRRSSSWANDQWLYFAIEFSEPFITAEIIDSVNNVQLNAYRFSSKIISGTALKSDFQFSAVGGKTIFVKCALSPVSCAGAWKNMQAEVPDWDFEKLKQQAHDTWNAELSKIEISSKADENKPLDAVDNNLVIFYTALYHCMIAPNIYQDVDGKYRGRDNAIHTSENFDYYTVFSLWDTYRALHPLLTIIDQKRTNDFINTFIKEYEQGKKLPVWELSSNETECMIGNHAIPVIADAALKGITNYDMPLAMEAMMHSANLDHYGLKFYKDKGYIESNEEPESVSKILEYSYDDWCIAKMLSNSPNKYKLKTNAETGNLDANDFLNRSKYFENILDNDLLVHPRFNGNWYSPYDPKEVNFNFTEANAWQYSFAYPQWMEEIILWDGDNGAAKKYESLLDNLFTTTSPTTGREQSDITGLIGQYAHGNEPSHHIAYLYNYALTPWKTQFYVNKIKTEFYKNAPDGLIGNEDCGQMSAWYVFSAMGFYPVCPGKAEYEIGTPSFDKIVIHTENKNTFTIQVNRESENSIYINKFDPAISAENIPKLSHEDILNKKGMTLNLSDVPTKISIIKDKNNYSKYENLLTAPIIEYANASFADSLEIQIKAPQNKSYFETENIDNIQIFYTLDGSNPTDKAMLYKNKIVIHQNTTIKTIRKFDGKYSGITTAHFTQLPSHYTLNYLTKYNAQYTAGGETALIDGMRGTSDFRTGMWQGWQKENMELVLDLGEIQEITSAGAGFLQDIRSWVWMPAKLEIYTSTDGKNYALTATIQNTIATNNYDSKEIQNLQTEFNPTKTRYIKFKAINFGPVPDWHPGKGGDTWIFCDEVWAK